MNLKDLTYLSTRNWIPIFAFSLLVMGPVFGACSQIEILPNLCYDDRNGTHMCGIICNEDQSICIDTDNPDLDCDTKDGQCHWPKHYYDTPKESTCAAHPENDWIEICKKMV